MPPPPPRRLFEFSGDQTFGRRRRHRLQTVEHDANGDDELTPGTLPLCLPACLPRPERGCSVWRQWKCMQTSRSLARTNIFPENPSSLPSFLACLPPTPLLFDYLPTHLVCPSVVRRRPNRRSLLRPGARPGPTARRPAPRPGCRVTDRPPDRPPLTKLQLRLWIPLGTQTSSTRHPKWKKLAFHLASSTQIRVRYATTTSFVDIVPQMIVIGMKGRKRRP